MRKIAVLPLVVLLSLPLACPAIAQDPAPAADAKPPADDHHKDAIELFVSNRHFHLDFVVREIGEDGKVMNSRSYAVIVGSDDAHPNYAQSASIRAGSKVPVYQNASKTVMQYQDVGVKIDCRYTHLDQGDLTLRVTAEVNSLADGPNTDGPPVVRQNNWESEVVLPLGKPTVLFSSDNVATKGKLQLELTATPVK